MVFDIVQGRCGSRIGLAPGVLLHRSPGDRPLSEVKITRVLQPPKHHWIHHWYRMAQHIQPIHIQSVNNLSVRMYTQSAVPFWSLTPYNTPAFHIFPIQGDFHCEFSVHSCINNLLAYITFGPFWQLICLYMGMQVMQSQK